MAFISTRLPTGGYGSPPPRQEEVLWIGKSQSPDSDAQVVLDGTVAPKEQQPQKNPEQI